MPTLLSRLAFVDQGQADQAGEKAGAQRAENEQARVGRKHRRGDEEDDRDGQKDKCALHRFLQ